MSRWYCDAWLPWGGAPRVEALPPEAHTALLRRGLLRSLDATVHLETRIVNPVARWVADGGAADAPFDAGLRRAAERLVAEEDAHAEAARALAEAAAMPGYRPRVPAFAERLELRVDVSDLPPWLVRFLFVVVTETTLSARLADHAAVPDLRPDVRQLLADHARDERWHARFFARCAAHLLRTLGPLASPARREVPWLVSDYVDVDLDAMAIDLAAVGLPAEAVRSTRSWVEARSDAARAPHLARVHALLHHATAPAEVP